ncbi:MAG TPA: methyltransferase domain-containing protein [bacterium]
MKKSIKFYNEKYHFEEDFHIGIDNKRIAKYFTDIEFKKNQKYLDIGCGVGWSLKYCINKGTIPFGVDISIRSLELTKRILNFNPYLVLADGQSLPFISESFDLVSALGTLEHFDSPKKGLEEINRVIKKNGQVIIVVPNSYGILNKLGLYKGTEQEQEMMATITEWVRYIQHSGFEIHSIKKDIGPRVLKNKNLFGIIKRFLLKITVFLPTAFAYCFIFSIKKQTDKH